MDIAYFLFHLLSRQHCDNIYIFFPENSGDSVIDFYILSDPVKDFPIIPETAFVLSCQKKMQMIIHQAVSYHLDLRAR